MAEIIPAIVSHDFAVVRERVALLEGLSDWVHLDVADGLFVAGYTWQGAEQLQALDGKIKIEIHLMVEQPEKDLTDWLRVADRLLIHPESTEHLNEILNQASEHVEIGLAILLETPLESLAEFLTRVKAVQLMGIKRLGQHGEPFEEAVISRVQFLRTRYPGVKISIDGGVNGETGRRCLAAGADRLVVGSAIWQSSDPLNVLRLLQTI